MGSRLYSLCSPLLAAPLLAGGCGSGLSGVEQRLASMREEITPLQNQNDRLVERVDALELRQSRAAPPVSSAQPAAGVSERPPLKIVRLVPGEGEPGSVQTGDVASGEAADDPGPRTVIRGRGSNIEGRLASGELIAEPEPPKRRKAAGAGGDAGQTRNDESPRDSKGD
jgi:hypothetical protein